MSGNATVCPPWAELIAGDGPQGGGFARFHWANQPEDLPGFTRNDNPATATVSRLCFVVIVDDGS